MIIAEPGSTIPNHDEHQWSVALDYLQSDVDEALTGTHHPQAQFAIVKLRGRKIMG
jgi:hypothetical protein